MKKLSFMCLFLICLSLVTQPVSAGIPNQSKPSATQTEKPEETTSKEISGSAEVVPYDAYIQGYKKILPADQTIIIKGGEFLDTQSAKVGTVSVGGLQNVLECLQENGTAIWEVNIPEDRMYGISFTYQAMPGKGKAIEIGLEIDGKYPFREAKALELTRVFQDKKTTDGRFVRDLRGNELTPACTELYEWRTMALRDPKGLHTEAFMVFFSAGAHTLTIHTGYEPFYLASLQLMGSADPEDYETYTAGGTTPSVTGFMQVVQAENASRKGDTTLLVRPDSSSPRTEPYEYMKVRMNVLGSANWVDASQWVEWEITVPQDGWYKLGFKYRQSFVRGLHVTRALTIDGETPFSELQYLRFSYQGGWDIYEPGGETPYQIYLKQGTHTLRMEPTLYDVAENIRALNDVQAALNRIYRKIIMITGVTPDAYRDYSLDQEIPELLEVFSNQASVLRTQAADLESLMGRRGSEAALLYRFAEQLESFVALPHTIAVRLANYRENISALAAWTLNAQKQPLELDYLYIASPDMEKPQADAGFFEKAWHQIRLFLGSFFYDYERVGGFVEGENPLTVWVGTARDQANIIKHLADETFYTQTGIPVNIKLVTSGLLAAVMAGKSPDVCLNQGRSSPVDMALRGAALPLEGFEGFDEVTSWFIPTAMEPFELMGSYYALPETQEYDMMFCRTDIFEELNLQPPETWDELYAISLFLQRRNMEVGLPYGGGTASIFTTLLLQKGGEFFNEEKTACLLDSRKSYEAFLQWVEFYAEYGYPLYKNDYNRFRTGEMPLIISGNSLYNQLRATAPEIDGLWEMLPIPGMRDEQNNILRSETSQGTACIVLASAKQPDSAWRFVRWWVSADTQAAFGNKLEMLMGVAARYSTANTEAMKSLKWTNAEIEILMRQREHVVDLPQIPGNYYVSRNLDNAFRSTLFQRENPLEMLTHWTRESNKEVLRKRREFGLSN